MPEVDRHPLLITLVHGTRFFPRLTAIWLVAQAWYHRRRHRRPLWFEGSSPFLARLRCELEDVPHKIRPLSWSGANSIFERDKAAHSLANYLLAEHAEHPRATQLIIAHSYGGNIALRALHHLQMRDVSHSADGVNPFVVTLATPFIEIHQANFGARPLVMRVAWLFVICYILSILVDFFPAFLFPSLRHEWYVVLPVIVILCVLMGWWWIFRRANTRQTKLDTLKNATRLGKLSGDRLFVIRAIDDEASLFLTFGTIVNYIMANTIMYLFLIFGASGPIILFSTENKWFPHWTYAACVAGFIVLTITFFAMHIASRLVHGRELALSPMECRVNTHSAPDAVDLSQIVTLVSHNYVKLLRHTIYEHEACVKVISDWVRSQLGAQRALESHH
jgi:hypothetical protein